MSDEIRDRVQALIRPEVQAMRAYAAPAAEGLIKLDAMENPYTWPAAIKQAWLEQLRSLDLNRYPDAQATELKTALRRAMQIPEGMAVMLGNGSDELILLTQLAVNRQGGKVLAPVPTFVMYEIIAQTVGMEFVGVPLLPDFGLDLPAMLAAIEQAQPAVIFLSYPNNPTANLFDEAAIETIIRQAPGMVVIDEAYAAFTKKSFLSRLGGFSNVLLMRTVSKIGLAGLRLGLLIGPPDWIQEIDKLRLPYNISSLTQLSARFILEHLATLDQQTQAIRRDREQLMQALSAINGIKAWPSETNFILFRLEGRKSQDVFKSLIKSGILVKNLDGSHLSLGGCLRVTVGQPSENTAFLSALNDAL